MMKSMIDGEQQNSEPDDEENEMMKDKLLSPLMTNNIIDDKGQDSQSDNLLFKAIDNFQFKN
jgi:hypothetical protein